MIPDQCQPQSVDQNGLEDNGKVAFASDEVVGNAPYPIVVRDARGPKESLEQARYEARGCTTDESSHPYAAEPA